MTRALQDLAFSEYLLLDGLIVVCAYFVCMVKISTDALFNYVHTSITKSAKSPHKVESKSLTSPMHSRGIYMQEKILCIIDILAMGLYVID